MIHSDSDTVHAASFARRWWGVLVGCALFGALVGTVLVGNREPVYEATLELLIGPVVPNADILDGTAQLARTYGEVLESESTIRTVARDLDISPTDVDIAADSSRGSSKLDVTIRTSDRSAAAALPDALVSRLDEVSSAFRIDVAPDGDEEIGAALFPGATSVVVISDVGAVKNQSFGRPLGALAGGIAAVLACASIVLSIERRERGFSDVVASGPHETPAIVDVRIAPWFAAFCRPGRLSLSVDDASFATAGDPIQELELRVDGDSRAVLIVAPTASRVYISAVLQLACAGKVPCLVVDPFGHIPRWTRSRITPGSGDRRFEIRSREAVQAHLLVPSRAGSLELDELLSRLDQDDLGLSGSNIMLFLTADAASGSHRRWRADADDAIVLASPNVDLTAHERLLQQLSAVSAPAIRSLRIRRRIITGRSVEVRLDSVSGSLIEAHGQAQPDTSEVAIS